MMMIAMRSIPSRNPLRRCLCSLTTTTTARRPPGDPWTPPSPRISPREAMPTPKVVVTSSAFPETLQLLEQAPAEVVVASDGDEPWGTERLLEEAKDAAAMVAFMPDRVDAGFLKRCPQLRIVACALKGFDNFDVEACTAAGVWITYVPGLLTEPTAELALGLMIGASRHVLAGDSRVRSGGFRGWRPVLYGRGLHGSTVGISGYGSLGRAIAQRLVGFGPQYIRWYDPDRASAAAECGAGAVAQPGTLEEVLGCDFVVVAAPLNPSSHHQVDGPLIKRCMGDHTVLVNVGRGGVVDEEAVAAALECGALGAYGADVFECEDWALDDRPLEVSARLRGAPRTLFTPHLGSAVVGVRRAIERSAAQEVVRVLKGHAPRHALNRRLQEGAPEGGGGGYIAQAATKPIP